jgi:hypothetical protein
MSFYPLRAALLLALNGRVDADAYALNYRVLAIAEMALEAWVAAEILLRLVGKAGGWNLRRGVAVLALVGIAFGLAWIALNAIPEKELVDRAQIFMGVLMLGFFAVAWRLGRNKHAGAGLENLTRIAAGFAAFAALQWAAMAGRAHAMAQHAFAAYVGWSYVPVCGYLAVVGFWLAALMREA